MMFQAHNFSTSASTTSGRKPAGATWASSYPQQESSVPFSTGSGGCYVCYMLHLTAQVKLKL